MKRPLQATDLYELQSVSRVVMCPDDRTVLFTIVKADAETNTYQSQIYSYRDGQTRQLTFGHNDSSPTVRGDGTQFAFLRNEPHEPAQPFVYTFETEQIEPVATFEDGASQIEWGYRDLYVRAAARPDDEVGLDKEALSTKIRVITTLDYRGDGRGWTHDRKQQVYRCSLRGGTPKLLTDLDFDHSAFAINADGSTLLVISDTDADSDLTGTSHVWSIDVVRGDHARLSPDGSAWAQVGWTLDGHAFGLGRLDIARDLQSLPYALAAGNPPQLLTRQDANHVNAIGGSAQPIAIDGALLVTANRRGATNIDRIANDGSEQKTVVDGPFMLTGFAANRAGSTIFAGVTTPSRPAELWKFENGLSNVVVSLNDTLFDKVELAKTQVVRVPSSDGVEVEAWVVTPPSVVAESAAVKPGLVYVHGGPFSAYGHMFFDEFQLAAAQGYVVIGANPRGSDGYGHEWGRCILGATGGADWDDLQAVTNYLADRADVDERRIGIGGGSYGGYLSSWAVSHSDRYRAALLERGLYNGETFMGTSDISTWFGQQFFGASIESDVDAIRRRSPITYAANITTPTLIVHAENDFRCPIEQAEQLFSALRRNGTEVTFVRVPGASHGLTRDGAPTHRVERFDIVHDFYAKHLKPKSRLA